MTYAGIETVADFPPSGRSAEQAGTSENENANTNIMIAPKPPAPRDGAEDHHVDTAENFLNTLSPRHALWSSNPPAWIYRGHADAAWELKARAVWDPNAFARYGLQAASTITWSERVELQRDLLARFRTGLDQSGLLIPSRSPRVHIEELNESTSNAEPLRESFPLMALAQHHGLPTMLLDWTRRAWIAAYFAAVEAADPEKPDSATHLAVWALHRGNLGGIPHDLLFYEAPGGTNPNLKAQSGLFTLLVVEDDSGLEKFLVHLKERTSNAPTLRRITLPTTEAPKLLRLLSYEGISGASMFPGADGVVRAMRETTLWDSSRLP